jgi:hypothetical protein
VIPSRADALPEETLPSDPAAPVPVKRRPARRPSKPDAVLAAAVDFARQGLLEVVPADQVGEHVTSYPEAERLTTHRFEAYVPGYGGWQWFVTLTRVPRGKEATISEVGLLPSEEALLAPEWLPWSERVRPEDHDDAAAPAQPADAPVQQEEGSPAPETLPAGPDAGDSRAADSGVEDSVVEDAAVEDADRSEPAGTDPTVTAAGSPDQGPAASGPGDSRPGDSNPGDSHPVETVPPKARRGRTRRVASAPAGDPFGNPFGGAPAGRDD